MAELYGCVVFRPCYSDFAISKENLSVLGKYLRTSRLSKPFSRRIPFQPSKNWKAENGVHMSKKCRVSAMSEKSNSSTGEKEKDSEPLWANPDSDNLPPWAKNEKKSLSVDKPVEIPFPVYLVGSALVSIAAVGSIFEYFNQNPVFGVVYPDNPLWAPILGVFAITGFPTAGYLFYKAISAANKASEEADKEDGYFD